MARQTRRNTTYRRSNNKSSLAGVWLTLGIFLGIFAMALAYVFFTNHPPYNKAKPEMASSANSKTKQETVVLENKSQQKISLNKQNQEVSKPQQRKRQENAQRFEFYTLLPGMEVEIPDRTTDTKAQSKSKNVRNASTTQVKEKPKTISHYIVQAGIFQEFHKADTLKAKLTLLGFSPAIQKVQTQEGNAWFRVTLGPFASEPLALNQKKRLEDQKIHGILILQRAN